MAERFQTARLTTCAMIHTSSPPISALKTRRSPDHGAQALQENHPPGQWRYGFLWLHPGPARCRYRGEGRRDRYPDRCKRGWKINPDDDHLRTPQGTRWLDPV